MNLNSLLQNRGNRSRSTRTISALGLLSVVLCMGYMGFADPVATLEKVELISHPYETEINLFTGTIIPYKQVFQSEDKLIIELSNISTPKSIQTNLAQAGNISHVIVQPISDTQVRMILKGQNLGKSAVHFKESAKAQSLIQSLNQDNQALMESTKNMVQRESTIHRVKAPSLPTNTPKEVLKSQALPPTFPSQHAKQPINEAPRETGLDNPLSQESLDLNEGSLLPDTDLTEGIDENESILSNELGTDPIVETAEKGVEKGLESIKPIVPEKGNQTLLDQLSQWGFQDIFPPLNETLFKILVGLGLLLVGLGAFIGHKLKQIKAMNQADQFATGHFTETPAKQRQQAAKLSFNALANAYGLNGNNGSEGSPAPNNAPQNAPQESRPLFAPNNHPKKANKWASKPAPHTNQDLPIGLGALLESIPALPQNNLNTHNNTPTNTRAVQPMSSKGIEQLLEKTLIETGRQPAPKPTLAKRQAVNQYQQQKPAPVSKSSAPALNKNNAPKNNAPIAKGQIAQKQGPNPVQAARQQADEKAQVFRSQRAERQKAEAALNAAKAFDNGNRNEPIPGNPQVLDFLKNVAEFMEKDGNSQRAQSIQKNLRPYQS